MINCRVTMAGSERDWICSQSGASAGVGVSPAQAVTTQKKKLGRPRNRRKSGLLGQLLQCISPKLMLRIQDVNMKLLSFSQQGPRTICILSATGVISCVTFRQPDTSGGKLTFEGRYDIRSFNGTFKHSGTRGMRSLSGGMSVILSSPDGHIIGGRVAGRFYFVLDNK